MNKSIKEYRIISTYKRACEECKEGPIILIYNTLISEEHLEGTFCLNCHEIKTFPKHECLTCKLEWREKRMNENLDRFLGIEDNGFCNNCPWKPGKDWIPWILDKFFNTIRFGKEYWIRMEEMNSGETNRDNKHNRSRQHATTRDKRG